MVFEGCISPIWRRQWQPTPVFLPGESQGRGSLVGCRLWGHTELDTTEVTWQQRPQQQQQQQLSYYFSCMLCQEDTMQMTPLVHSGSVYCIQYKVYCILKV